MALIVLVTHRTVSPAVTVAVLGSISSTSTLLVAVPAVSVTVCVPSALFASCGIDAAVAAATAPVVSLVACAAAVPATAAGVLTAAPAATTSNDATMPGWIRHTNLTVVPAATLTFTKKCVAPSVGCV